MRVGSGSAFTDQRRAKVTRKYRTQCKHCGMAVYEDQPAKWSSGENKPVGLVHEECP